MAVSSRPPARAQYLNYTKLITQIPICYDAVSEGEAFVEYWTNRQVPFSETV